MPMPEDPAPKTPDAPLDTVRDEDFTVMYASNAQFESTVWDLKVLFGDVDLAQSKISQHTSMALSWPLAKIVAYYMLVNVIFHEANSGARVIIPPPTLPAPPNPDAPDLNDAAKRVATYLRWVHEQFFGTNPYVPPEVQALMDATPKEK